MTKTKYVLTGLMIFFGILFLGGFFLPFYSANIVGSLGSQSVNGSLTASGIGFILGLSAIKTGYFETKNIFVQQNILFMVIGILAVILLVLAIVSIALKHKDSVMYHFLNLIAGIIGVTSMFLLIFSLQISNISLRGELVGYEHLIQSEGLAYGSLISIFGSGIYGLLALVLTFISFFGYRIARKFNKRKGYAGPLIEEEKKLKLGFNGSKLLENKYIGKFIGFFKKEDKEEVPSLEEKNEETNTEEIKKEEENKTTKEKSLQEKLADLDKLHNNHQISDAEYKKFRQALVEKHYADKNK